MARGDLRRIRRAVIGGPEHGDLHTPCREARYDGRIAWRKFAGMMHQQGDPGTRGQGWQRRMAAAVTSNRGNGCRSASGSLNGRNCSALASNESESRSNAASHCAPFPAPARAARAASAAIGGERVKAFAHGCGSQHPGQMALGLRSEIRAILRVL